MKLKMLTTYATATRMVHAGKIAEFSDEEAKQLLDGRYAMRVEDQPETTSRRPLERAMRRRAEPIPASGIES